MRGSLPPLARLVGECADLLTSPVIDLQENRSLPKSSFAVLLGDCARLASVVHADDTIRTVHHFACTGGTLICKVLASMPNVHLLSEVEPFSQFAPHDPSGFAPTDMIALNENSSRGGWPEATAAIFAGALDALHGACRLRGLRLVLRDHSHSRYCGARELLDAPGLLELAKRVSQVASIITVRHPLDSFLSLRHHKWIAFEPASLDEYCRRYRCFLKDHPGIEIFRYEDFVASPVEEARKMSEALLLPFNDRFEELFEVYRLSGDSGRSRAVIGLTERRPVPYQVRYEVERSAAYAWLCDRLEYPRF